MINLTEIDKSKFEDIANYWNDQMPMMVMEECGELIQAISKYERVRKGTMLDERVYNNRLGALKHRLELEIRDVYISLEAIKIMYDISDDTLLWLIRKKINKKY